MKRGTVPSRRAVEVPSATRAVPEAAQVLLPVWGHYYVRQFLQFGLPTLLSRGNLPYVAAKLPCQLVVLTCSEDSASIVNSPLMERARAVGCDVQVHIIDHLVTAGNQSTTITLAFTEAILAANDSMLTTCFFLTVSDYIYADGSLKSVLDRMLSGSSAVLVGNFQVVRETGLPSLRRILEWEGQAPALQSRQLMAWALTHLHPATVANTVNIPFNHNAHTNRLFWRVDESTLLGRFYLRHPICIQPETTDFLIGSSLDYSFIPEMCPSGNVTSITDSDEYLVVEMQPGGHEAGLLRFGPLRTRVLAKSLAEWTTKEHRANAADVHVYHSGELPPQMASVRQESDTFIAAVARRLRGTPRPHRGHHYWKGAIAAYSAARPPESRRRNLDHIYDLQHMSRLSCWWWSRHYLMFGQPPDVRPWDRSWPDYAAVRAELRDATGTAGARLLLVANSPTIFSVALSTGSASVQRLRTESLVRNPPLRPQAIGPPFDACLIELSDNEVPSAKVVLQRVRPCLVPGGRILILANLSHDTAMRWAALRSPGVSLLRARLVARTALCESLYRVSRSVHHTLARQPWFGVPLALVLGPPVVAASVVTNLLTVYHPQPTSQKVRNYSSLIMVLEAEPRESPSDATRTSLPVSLGVSSVDSPEVPAPAIAANRRYATGGLS